MWKNLADRYVLLLFKRARVQFGCPLFIWPFKWSLANIFSLAAVQKICRVTMVTLMEAAIIIHKHNSEQMEFKESASSLFFHNTKPKSKSTNYFFINSVSENKSLYTRQQLESTDLAKQVYELVIHPSYATFTKMISENELQHCVPSPGTRHLRTRHRPLLDARRLCRYQRDEGHGDGDDICWCR